MVSEFAQKEVKSVCREAEKTATVPEELVKKAQEIGLHLVTLPEEYGGLGLDCMSYAVVREELARGDSGFASRVFGFGFEPLKLAGTEDQKRWAADIMIRGGVIAFGLTESTGSDAGAMKTTARKVGDDYVINGGKTFITNLAFLTPTATVPITMTLQGGYRFLDYTKMGAFVMIGCVLLSIISYPFVFSL